MVQREISSQEEMTKAISGAPFRMKTTSGFNVVTELMEVLIQEVSFMGKHGENLDGVRRKLVDVDGEICYFAVLRRNRNE